MNSLFVTFFVISALMIMAGFLGKVGTDGFNNIGENVASALGLLFVFTLLVVSLGSYSEFLNFFEAMCGGIPVLSQIADYGSLKQVFIQNPKVGAEAFLDVVFLSAFVDFFVILPLGKRFPKGVFFQRFMVYMFEALVAGIIGFLVLKHVVKSSDVYQFLAAAVAIIISGVTLGTMPLSLTAVITKKRMAGIGFMGVLAVFSQSRAVGVLRSAFFKSLVYLYGIWMLEEHFGSIANGFSQISLFFVAFAPVVVMIIGLVFILKSLFS